MNEAVLFLGDSVLKQAGVEVMVSEGGLFQGGTTKLVRIFRRGRD